MNSQARARWRLRGALFGAVLLFCVGWAGFLAVLVKRAGAASDAQGLALSDRLPRPVAPEGLLGAAAAAVALPEVVAAGAPRPRALLVEHDDLSLVESTRHLVRGTVPSDLPAVELRRLLDEVVDEERLDHPQVDAIGVYLYEEPVYARFAGRATPLEAAVAHATWAPAGDWTQPARRSSHLDNRTVHVLPKR